ncbi:hypothetical protein V2J09_020059 [Rumex salicifolius]
MKHLNNEYEDIGNEFRIFNGEVTRKNHSAKQTDIELITIQPNSYTSLRDIIAASSAALGGASSPSTAPASPTCWKSTRDRDDVPIKNQLVKQAALAYLQPLSSSPSSTEGRSWPQRLKGNLNSCFAVDGEGEIGCIGPLDGVVLAAIKEAFGRFLRAFLTVERREEHQD